jgi:polyribonucleotide nucleotidyltransferase
MGSPGRREIGHGALAEKALRRVIPSTDIFPYTIRIVSEVLSSNGSTSMASACGSSIALMDAGVPLNSHVAGIAMGLVYTSDEEYVLLTDILGKEDHWGDMDFKVAGTNTGITAIQLDCKFHGLSSEMVAKTLTAAYEARLTILQSMNDEISKPRELTSHIEKVEVMIIPQDKIGRVIGSGGVTIKKITKESGAKIDIKRDGQTYITGASTSIEKARSAITALL